MIFSKKLMSSLALLGLISLCACGGWYKRWGIKNEKELHSFAAVPKLIKVLERGSCHEMHNAAEAIYEIGEQARSALWALEKVVKKDDCLYRHRLPAARALGRLGRPALSMLQKMSAHKDGLVRYLAVVGLGEMTYKRDVVVGILGQKIVSRDPLDKRGAREEAYHSLGRQGDAARLVIPVLVEQLQDPDWRVLAMDCLVAIGHPTPEAVAGMKKLMAESEDEAFKAEVKGRLDKLSAPKSK